MKRGAIAILALVALGLSSSAQMWPQRVDPKSDPKAFMIITQANLDDALTRIRRLKGQLKETRDKAEREFLVNAILEVCQAQLNEDRNDSGVVVVERTDQVFYLDDQRRFVDEDASVYDLPIRWQGAFSAIEDEIRSLGEEGLNKYEATYGARAALLLGQALETRQRERIQYLNRRFGLTRAGIRAGELLASLYWEEGETSKAARYLERVLALRELLTPQQQADYSAWLAHCYRNLGERANLLKLIQQTVELRETQVDTGGKMAPLGELLQARLLEARDATTDTIDNLGVEWPGGNYTNTGLHEKPSDYRQIAWTRKLPGLAAAPNWRKFMEYPAPIVPPYLPLFDGDMFYINTGDRLVAYSLLAAENDGPSWSCKPFATNTNNWRVSEPDPSMILPVSMYRGTLFTAIENPLNDRYHNPNPDPNFGLYSHYPKVRRALCAVDGSSGRLLWKMGGQYEGNDLETLSFLSAVVHEGTLYAIASRAGHFAEIFLYALSASDGEVLWNLRLCYGQQETTMFGRPAREPHPSLPCFAGGNLYLCTNIGGVVAVELATRSLSWISRYEYIPRPTTKYLKTYYRDVTWYNSPTIYAEHKGKPYVLVAPTDSRQMFALDAHSGKIVWGAHEANMRGARSLVGVREGKAYVAGDGGNSGLGASMLYVVDLEQGRVTNSMKVTPLNGGSVLALAGRPSIAANRLLWPGKEYGADRCTIAEVDLDKLRVVNSVFVSNSYRGYNVLAQHGVVFTISDNDYSAGNSWFAARFNSQSLLEVAREEYRAQPDSADAACRYGMITMRLGDRAEAIKALQAAFTLASKPPADTRVRDHAGRALVAAWLESADKALVAGKFTEALGHVQNAREFATVRSQFSECFVREEAALAAQGRAGDMEDFYRAIIEQDPDFGMGADPEIPVAFYARIKLASAMGAAGRDAEASDWWQQVQQAPSRLSWEGTSLRSLAIGRLRDAIKRAGRQVYAKQDAAAVALAAQPGPESWRKILELYPLAKIADEAALELANTRLAAFYPAEGAEVLRTALDENSDRPRAGEMNALLALCYRAAGEQLRARLLAARVLREHPSGELKVGGKTRAFQEALKPLLATDGDDAQEKLLPRLPQQISHLWTREWDVSGFTRLPLQPVSSADSRYHVSERTRMGNHLVALDASNGEPAWSRQVDVSVTAVHRVRRGALFVLSQGFALYDDEGNEQWATPGGGTPDPVSLSGGMLVYSTRLSNPTKGKNLVHITALDVDSGGVIWQTYLDANSTRWIGQHTEGVLVMTLGNETELVLLNAETGTEVARHTLGTESRVTAAPLLDDSRLLVVDRDGMLSIFDAAKLRPSSRVETKVRYPTTLQMVDDDYLVVGLNSAARVRAKDATAAWYTDFASNEVVTAHAVMKGAVAVASRNPSGAGKVTSYGLADGKVQFTYTIPRNADSDRVDLQSALPFDDGIVMLFNDRRIIDGRMQVWGFRLVVLNSDGAERFSWEHHSPDAPLFVQMALVDNGIAITCASTTFGFGRSE